MADKYEKNLLAEIIKLQRKKLGLTQEELAEKIDLSTQHLSKIENGHSVPSLETFLKIIEILHIDLNLIKPNTCITNDKNRLRIINFIKTAADAEIKFIADILDMTLAYKEEYKI